MEARSYRADRLTRMQECSLTLGEDLPLCSRLDPNNQHDSSCGVSILDGILLNKRYYIVVLSSD